MGVWLVNSMSIVESSQDMIHPFAVCVSQERNSTDSSKRKVQNHVMGDARLTVAWM